MQWLEESRENPRFLAEYIANLSLHDALLEQEAEVDTDKMLARVNARIDADISIRQRRSRTFRFIGLAAGCVALFVMGIFFGMSRLRAQDAPEAGEMVAQTLKYVCTNKMDRTRSVVLADGTKVYLTPGSSIRYDVAGSPDSRTIRLDGEGYFDVARDSLRPLTVQTGNIAVKVLGTKFSVSSGSDNPNTEVMLESGSVRVLSPEGHNLVNLIPGQAVRYIASEDVLSVSKVSSKAYLAEHFNLVSLVGVTIDEIINSLEASYDVKLSARQPVDRVKKYHFQYLENEPIDDVLTVLEFLSGTRCETINQTN